MPRRSKARRYGRMAAICLQCEIAASGSSRAIVASCTIRSGVYGSLYKGRAPSYTVNARLSQRPCLWGRK